MKRVLLALAIALGTLAAPAVEASAASVTIGENGITVRDGHRDSYRHGRRHYRDGWRRGYNRRCRVKVVKTYRHHRVIVRKVRVCR